MTPMANEPVTFTNTVPGELCVLLPLSLGPVVDHLLMLAGRTL
jgi:hypothetical protein